MHTVERHGGQRIARRGLSGNLRADDCRLEDDAGEQHGEEVPRADEHATELSVAGTINPRLTPRAELDSAKACCCCCSDSNDCFP